MHPLLLLSSYYIKDVQITVKPVVLNLLRALIPVQSIFPINWLKSVTIMIFHMQSSEMFHKYTKYYYDHFIASKSTLFLNNLLGNYVIVNYQICVETKQKLFFSVDVENRKNISNTTNRSWVYKSLNKF